MVFFDRTRQCFQLNETDNEWFELCTAAQITRYFARTAICDLKVSVIDQDKKYCNTLFRFGALFGPLSF